MHLSAVAADSNTLLSSCIANRFEYLWLPSDYMCQFFCNRPSLGQYSLQYQLYNVVFSRL